MINLEKEGEVFVLTMDDGENRWNTTFTRAFAEALDEVEASEGPAALVTTSSSEKFFSNGLDLEWRMSEGEHRGGDREVFGPEFMTLMGRIITFPVPTIAAINGHAFGAGLMCALSHDIRLMREDRGFACANEVEIGMVIPNPELALFRHKLPMNTFFQTVQLARRWTGPDAVEGGIAEAALPLDKLLDRAVARGAELARLGANRKVYSRMKEAIYGENAAINNAHGPAHMLKNMEHFH
ncbi:MAG: enoyl-CoA hydratase/isomerase family protein [Pseudomonadales bacterium]|nr:enoyl-CoA hydratase/isomerase family protein [Pseudomonadales bacterium]MBO6565770.1 enoyl-CoA hydratase/isomerase family protein [Pseudomonadales bacterium]MBO6596890.1 enoyl-CoA hydratase/isomerase family protein [Pseudomonadales bacterium]MBO6658961.1 enoyl-CoA hydratase/isomerase family protein [Pseudomonadales bacterium]MBO6703561.1 enoyl-CoA hydratase/isomerase family protein [Pseudomonadales bacterium]